MTNLEQAQALMNKRITLSTMNKLDSLLDNSVTPETEAIYQLWEQAANQLPWHVFVLYCTSFYKFTPPNHRVSNMTNLEKAKAILEQPVTLESLHMLDMLNCQSTGVEAVHVGMLWESALNQAPQDVLDEYYLAFLEQ